MSIIGGYVDGDFDAHVGVYVVGIGFTVPFLRFKVSYKGISPVRQT